MSGKERVFAVSLRGLLPQDAMGLYRATSASKARYMAYRSAKEAFSFVKFGDLDVQRAPKYDAVSFPQGSSPRYVKLPLETP